MMFEHRSHFVSFECFDDFGKEQATAEAADDLVSAAVIAYERAIERGTNPAAALTALLDWASQEIRRYIR
jgi:hypothetical protein